MKEGRTLIEMANELERQRAAKKDYISDTRNLRMDATGDGLQLSLRDDRSHVVHMKYNLKINFICFFMFLNVVTRKFKVSYGA